MLKCIVQEFILYITLENCPHSPDVFVLSALLDNINSYLVSLPLSTSFLSDLVLYLMKFLLINYFATPYPMPLIIAHIIILYSSCSEHCVHYCLQHWLLVWFPYWIFMLIPILGGQTSHFPILHKYFESGSGKNACLDLSFISCFSTFLYFAHSLNTGSWNLHQINTAVIQVNVFLCSGSMNQPSFYVVTSTWDIRSVRS